MDLSNKNANYTATQAVRTKARALYDGADVVKAASTTYLFQGPNESDDAYAVRLGRAVYEPLVAKVINARMAMLFRKEAARQLPARLKEFETDVNLRGINAQTFFEQVSRDAQVDGIAWVSVDMPTAPEGGYVSKDAEKTANHRPFFEQIPANNVVDWEVGADGKLLWAVIEEKIYTPRPEPGVAQEEKTAYKVWTRLTWQRWMDDAVIAEGVNTSGVVPLVPFLGAKHTDYSGWPVTRGILDIALLIYNKASDLDWFEYLAAHPIPYCIAPKKLEMLDSGKGIWIDSSSAGDAQITLGYLEPTGAGFASTRESIADLRAALYAVALTQAKKDTAQVQSADTLKEERNEFNASLATISRSHEAAEIQCWQLADLWMGGASGDVAVAYNRDWDDALIDAVMIATVSSLVLSDQLTLETFLTILRDGERLPSDFDIQAEVAKLTAQAAARSAVAVEIATGHTDEGQNQEGDTDAQ